MLLVTKANCVCGKNLADVHVLSAEKNEKLIVRNAEGWEGHSR